MIINKNQIYYLNSHTQQKELRNDYFIWESFNNNDFKNLIIGVEFGSSDAFNMFPLDTILHQYHFALLKNKRAKLFLVNSHEAFHYIIGDIYTNIIKKYNLDPNQITLFSESADIKAEVQKFAELNNIQSFNTAWSRRFEHDVQCNKRIMTNNYSIDIKTLEIKDYTKKYLFFNRRWRFHRPLAVALLQAENILDKGFVSLGRSDDNKNWNNFWHRLDSLKILLGEEVYEKLNSCKDQIMSIPEMYLDTPDLTTNRAILTPNTDYLYEQTYVSIVGETNFLTTPEYESGRFLSEKTFKPIAQKHPFIIISVPFMLQKLREIGYRTFHPFIDESYDSEMHDGTRMLKIIQEIKRLSNLSGIELQQYLMGCKEICEHNLEVLKSKKTFITNLN